MYRVLADTPDGGHTRLVELDDLLSALFHALTWSFAEGARVYLLDGPIVLCSVACGELRANGVPLDVDGVVARAERIRCAA